MSTLDSGNGQISVKELKYDSASVLVEIARKALMAKADASGNIISDTYALKSDLVHISIVNDLPKTGQANYIYLKKHSATSTIYDIYIWNSAGYINAGGTEIDLSGKLDKLTTENLHVYTHTGATQSELLVDTTSGGTASSASLITSGAVNAGLSDKITKDVDNLTNYTKTSELGTFATKSDLASTELSDSSDLIRTSNIANNLTTAATGSVLDASQGKVLADRVDALEGRGRFLSSWNCTTHLPATYPTTNPPYSYKAGDYYIVSAVGETNYRPAGTQITKTDETWNVPYATESLNVGINDYYVFDGTNWILTYNTSKTVSWGTIAGTLANQSDLNTALDGKADDEDVTYSNSNGTTVAIGGIAKGTTFTNKSLKSIIEDMLYPYVKFSFSGISTTDASGTYEYGALKTVTKVRPSFTLGSEAITLIKIGTTSGGDDLYSGTAATSGSDITLTNSLSIDGLSDKTVYCTIGDGNNTDTKSATFSFTKYNYYKVTAALWPIAPTSGGTIIGTGTEVASLTTIDNSYIWFLCPEEKTTIQQYAMSQWNNMNTTSAGTVNFTTSTGQTITYYAYRTDALLADTARYRII